MGNNCCYQGSSTPKYHGGFQNPTELSPLPEQNSHSTNSRNPLISSSSTLQHISQREPDDNINDPSSCPTAQTMIASQSRYNLMMQSRQSKQSRVGGENSMNRSAIAHSNSQIMKSSSCSTIFIPDSTASQPNMKYMLKAVALAIYYHLRNPARKENPPYLEVYDERLHPLSNMAFSPDFDQRVPDYREIYRFLRLLFHAAQLTAECAIITMIYLERILTYSEADVIPVYWKRMVLGSVLLASKVWDDQAVWNVDFCTILKEITVEEMNELERGVLELLQFNINVPSSVYAKYYFDLRALAEENGLSLPSLPLDAERAARLEALTLRADQLKIQFTRRAASLEDLNSPVTLQRSLVIS